MVATILITLGGVTSYYFYHNNSVTQQKNSGVPLAVKQPNEPCVLNPDELTVKKSDVVQIALSKGISSATTSNVATVTNPLTNSCEWHFEEPKIQVCTQCPESGTRVNRQFDVNPVTGEVSNFSDTFCYTCDMGRFI